MQGFGSDKVEVTSARVPEEDVPDTERTPRSAWFVMDGVDDYLLVNSSSRSDAWQDFQEALVTVSVWARPQQTYTSESMGAYDQSIGLTVIAAIGADGSPAQLQLVFGLSSAGRLAVQLMEQDGSTIDCWASQQFPYDWGQWHLYSFTFDESTNTVRLYRDGAEVGSRTWQLSELSMALLPSVIQLQSSSTTRWYFGGFPDLAQAPSLLPLRGSIGEFSSNPRRSNCTRMQPAA